MLDIPEVFIDGALNEESLLFDEAFRELGDDLILDHGLNLLGSCIDIGLSTAKKKANK